MPWRRRVPREPAAHLPHLSDGAADRGGCESAPGSSPSTTVNGPAKGDVAQGVVVPPSRVPVVTDQVGRGIPQFPAGPALTRRPRTRRLIVLRTGRSPLAGRHGRPRSGPTSISSTSLHVGLPRRWPHGSDRRGRRAWSGGWSARRAVRWRRCSAAMACASARSSSPADEAVAQTDGQGLVTLQPFARCTAVRGRAADRRWPGA